MVRLSKSFRIRTINRLKIPSTLNAVECKGTHTVVEKSTARNSGVVAACDVSPDGLER